MRARMKFAGLLGTAVVASLTFAIAGEEGDFKATCPVSGKAAKESSRLDYKGKKVYFCCNNCPKAFQKNPEKFTAKTNHQLLQTGQITQFACPFTGKSCNPDTKVELAGAEFCFCCNNCKGKYEKAKDQFTLVFAKIGKGFTTQAKCPVSGEDIDLEHSVTHDGRKVFFCCGNCPKKFKADPDKYAEKLPPEIK